MTVTNAVQYSNLPWDDYIKLPGYSFSGLRNPDRDTNFQPTPKMRLGSAVDNYIFTPKEYNGEMFELVRPVAVELRKVLGSALDLGRPQVSFTADFCHAGLKMPYRGRCDLLIAKLIVDLKVSELPIHKSIEYFMYHHQISGYALAGGCEKAMIISIHPKTHKISMTMINIVADWWEYQVKVNGSI